MTASVVRLFSEGEQPLQETHLHTNDPGLFGPNSVSWKVMGDVSSFVGGVRALLLQALHPEVAAGVADHSQYKTDPLGRLNRTSFFVTTVNYGAMPEVQEAVAVVRAAHKPVSGTSERGIAYSANQPQLGAWVQNTLTDSFLDAYQNFCQPLEPKDADRFVLEQSKIGELLGISELPLTAQSYANGSLNIPSWVALRRSVRLGRFSKGRRFSLLNFLVTGRRRCRLNFADELSGLRCFVPRGSFSPVADSWRLFAGR